MKSIIIKRNNEVEEYNESETAFNEAVDGYVATNAERLAESDLYKALERSQRGYRVCSQLEKVAQKGKSEFQQSILKAQKLLDSQEASEVKRYTFVEEVKGSIQSPFGKVALAFLIPAFLFWGLTKLTPPPAEAEAEKEKTKGLCLSLTFEVR